MAGLIDGGSRHLSLLIFFSITEYDPKLTHQSSRSLPYNTPIRRDYTMPLDPPGRLTLPPPSFPQGPQRNEMLDLESPTVATAPRVSFGHYSYRRPSHGSHAKFGPLDEEMGGAEPPIFELPPIPTAISKGDDNPLPKLPMIVLSIVRDGFQSMSRSNN